MFLILAVSFFMFMKSDHFTVSKILVNGNVKLTQTEIIDSSGIKKGQNLFDYNTKKAEENILSLSYAESVEVVREYPDTVHIYVLEKKGSMAYLTGGVYYYLDENGMVLKTESSLTDTDVMIVSFAENTEGEFYEVGSIVDLKKDPRLAIAKSVYDFSKKNDLTHYISEFYVSSAGVNYIYTTRSNVIKFYTYAAFEENEDFIGDFITYEDRHIMAEVVEGSRPVYKVIEIE